MATILRGDGGRSKILGQPLRRKICSSRLCIFSGQNRSALKSRLRIPPTMQNIEMLQAWH
jgi:hypothetical protein